MKIAEKVKSQGPAFLRYHLHRHLAGYEAARDHATVHASDLLKEDRAFCARELALLDATNAKKPDEFVHTARRMAFRASSRFQELVTEIFVELGMAVGDWKCNHCGRAYTFQYRPKSCTGCQGEAFRYRETVWRSQYSGISGSMDLLLDLGEGAGLRAVEVKALQASDFKSLVAPLAEHRWRTNLYLRLIEESGRPEAAQINTQQGWVLYMAKGGFGVKDPDIAKWGLKDSPFSPFKEYRVARNDADTEKLVQKARALHLHRKQQGPLPDRICKTLFEKRAQQCAVGGHCFGVK